MEAHIQHARLRQRQRSANARRVRSDQIALQLFEFVIANNHVRKVTKTGVDTIRHFAARQHPIHHSSADAHALPRLRRQIHHHALCGGARHFGVLKGGVRGRPSGGQQRSCSHSVAGGGRRRVRLAVADVNQVFRRQALACTPERETLASNERQRADQRESLALPSRVSSTRFASFESFESFESDMVLGQRELQQQPIREKSVQNEGANPTTPQLRGPCCGGAREHIRIMPRFFGFKSHRLGLEIFAQR